MKKNLTILLLCILLTSCVKSEFQDASVRHEYIYNNKKGMIVTQIRVPYRNVLHQPGSYNGYMIVRDLNTNVKYKVNGASYYDSASMILPGTYQIDVVGWDDGAFSYSFKVTDSELQAINLRFGAFEVKPGECLYLGDIVINKNAQEIDQPLHVSNGSMQMLQSLETTSISTLRSQIKFYSLLHDSNLVKKNIDGKYGVYKGQQNG